jgi:hypothetical protein
LPDAPWSVLFFLLKGFCTTHFSTCYSAARRKTDLPLASKFLIGAIVTLFLSSPALTQTPSQKDKTPVLPVAPLLTRTTTRRESQRLGFGGTVTIVGAPRGSVTIEGWSRSEVELTADIELKAPTEEDLSRLSTINTFVFDQDLNHVSVLTTGTHDRAYMKQFKNFPKTLLNLPWKIDYRIKVPATTDLEVNAGHGALKISGVEGAMRVSATESDSSFTLTGGVVSATIAVGSVTLSIPTRSWRGGGADIRVAAGALNVEIPPGFSGDIDADVLRVGQIVNAYDGLEAREKPGVTDRTIRARAGAGGPFFKFTVGDGTLTIKKSPS